MSQIVDIHSQFETHQLFNESYHLKLLDNFIGNELTDLKKEYLTLYQTYKNLNQKYLSLTKEELTDEQFDLIINIVAANKRVGNLDEVLTSNLKGITIEDIDLLVKIGKRIGIVECKSNDTMQEKQINELISKLIQNPNISDKNDLSANLKTLTSALQNLNNTLQTPQTKSLSSLINQLQTTINEGSLVESKIQNNSTLQNTNIKENIKRIKKMSKEYKMVIIFLMFITDQTCDLFINEIQPGCFQYSIY